MIKLSNIGELATYHPREGKVRINHNTELFISDQHITASTGEQVEKIIDCQGKLVTPGFVDPHTHPVFYRGRQDEFAQRLAGATYQEIAAAGGGIRSSIAGVRSASHDELIRRTSARLDRFAALGTTTIEAKSGYGLSSEAELKSLAVLGELNESHPLDILPTFLGAHAFPAEYSDLPDEYVELICDEMIPAVARQGIAKFCDVFCENGYYTVEQSRRILETAKNFGLTPRLHADEFEDSGAAQLAAEVEALSADHLMAISPAGIEALRSSKVIATLLPGTTFFLGQSNYAPARTLLDNGITVALATDFNPGSCHIQSMPFIISLATIQMGMSLNEAFAAATYFAAQSLGIATSVGHLSEGAQADFIIWGVDHLAEIPYTVTDLPIHAVYKRGRKIFGLD